MGQALLTQNSFRTESSTGSHLRSKKTKFKEENDIIPTATHLY